MFEFAARLFRRAKLPLARFFRDEAEPIETRRELSERFLRELDELVWDGEFSRGVAEQIARDIFEPPAPGRRPLVRVEVWQSYIRDRTGSVALYAVGGRHDPDTSKPSPR